MRKDEAALILLLLSPFLTIGSHISFHCHVEPTRQLRLPALASTWIRDIQTGHAYTRLRPPASPAPGRAAPVLAVPGRAQPRPRPRHAAPSAPVPAAPRTTASSYEAEAELPDALSRVSTPRPPSRASQARPRPRGSRPPSWAAAAPASSLLRPSFLHSPAIVASLAGHLSARLYLLHPTLMLAARIRVGPSSASAQALATLSRSLMVFGLLRRSLDRRAS